MNFVKKYFQLDQMGTTVKTEFIAGLTTFISMSYILFVNPDVLGASGIWTRGPSLLPPRWPRP